MTKKLPSFLAVFAAMTLVVHAEDEDGFVRHPISVTGFTEWGQLMNGEIATQNRQSSKFQALQRTGMGVSLSATYKEILDLRASFGGIFWYSLPELPAAHERLPKGGAGIGEVTGIYHIPLGDLQFGLFGEKYNSDAKNLGEYLFRSGTYPATLMTGGFELVNTAGFLAQGVKFSMDHFGGKFHHELGIFAERGNEPNFDLSPNYLFTYKPNPVFEIGGGAVFAHLIQIQPDKDTPKARINAYNVDTKKPLEGDDALSYPGYAYYGPNDPRNDPRLTMDSTLDNTKIPTGPMAGEKYVWINKNGTPENKIDYYTFSGVKLMGRFALNLQNALHIDALGSEDLKLYGEVAVLGVKNYPYYYEKMVERMPLMIGFNLPTFKALDVLSVEMEYYKNPFPDDIFQVRNNALPIQNIPNIRVPDPTDTSHTLTRDMRLSDYERLYKGKWANLTHAMKWTVYAKRSIGKAVSVYAMAASDHTHPIHFFGDPDDRPFTRRYQDWYYALRLQTNF
jgi:hypothetical protein